jgi:hypothetical protein
MQVSTPSVSAYASSGSISVIGLLGAVLVVLKLLGKIDISWWLVLAPFWLPAAIIILILLVVLAVAGILDWSDNKGRK